MRGFRVWLKAYWPLLAILLATVAVRAPLLGMEFGRNGDGTGSFYGILARNYLLRDNSKTMWVPVISVGPGNEPVTLYAHHPPSVPVLTAVSMKVFGDHDYAVRLPAFLFTLASVGALYQLLLRRISIQAAAAGGMMLAFVPLSLRFGQMPDVVNSQLVFAGVVITGAYLRLIEGRGTGILPVESLPAGSMIESKEDFTGKMPVPGRSAWRLVGVCLALLFGFATDWPAFFLVPILIVHLAVARPGGWVRAAVVIGGVATAAFAGLYVWISLATGNWYLILHQFLNRSTQAQTDNALPFSWGTWAAGVWGYNWALHTWPLMAMAAVGVVAAVACKPHRRVRVMVGVPAAWAVVHVLVGRQAVLNHDWWWWPMTLALCAAAGSLVGLFARGRVGTVVCFAGLVALCGWWTVTEWGNLHSSFWMRGALPEYSPGELGVVARQYTSPGRAVILFDADEQPYVIYNADRPVVQKVWDVAGFEKAMSERRALLFYTFGQALDRPPQAFVLPQVYEGKAGKILPYLRDHYRESVAGAFLVFDLDHPTMQGGANQGRNAAVR